ncbi:MAG: site-specific integrase [Proteobacteria bacterium]|nr:site-specific integrase [Pseudomonadota bacterium]
MRGSIQRSGKTSWRIRFDLGTDKQTGKRRVQSVVVQGKKADAQRRMAELLAAKGNGTFVEASKLTVAEHVRQRVDHWEKAGEISSRTADRYRELVENQIVPHLGNVRLQGLRTLDVEGWHATLRVKGRKDGGPLAPRTIHHAHRVLGKALRDGARHGLLSRVVTGPEGQRAPKVETEEVVVIPPERIPEVIQKLKGRALYPKIVVALFTGVRRGELLGLRWSDIDLKGKVLRVRQAVEEAKRKGESGTVLRLKTTKTKAGRRDVSLPDIVVEALSEHRREQLEQRMAMGLGKPDADDLVFPALEGGPQRPSNLSGDWRAAVRSLKLPDVSLHALRHTHASQLIDAGIDVVKISKRLGHASPHITLMVYAHLFGARDIVSAEAINAALMRS